MYRKSTTINNNSSTIKEVAALHAIPASRAISRVIHSVPSRQVVHSSYITSPDDCILGPRVAPPAEQIRCDALRRRQRRRARDGAGRHEAAQRRTGRRDGPQDRARVQQRWPVRDKQPDSYQTPHPEVAANSLAAPRSRLPLQDRCIGNGGGSRQPRRSRASRRSERCNAIWTFPHGSSITTPPSTSKSLPHSRSARRGARSRCTAS